MFVKTFEGKKKDIEVKTARVEHFGGYLVKLDDKRFVFVYLGHIFNIQMVY